MLIKCLYKHPFSDSLDFEQALALKYSNDIYSYLHPYRVGVRLAKSPHSLNIW